MSVGWTLLNDNRWYYFNQKGHLATDEWVDDKYVDYSEKMLTDTWTPDGYYVGADGKWVKDYQGSSGTFSGIASSDAPVAKPVILWLQKWCTVHSSLMILILSENISLDWMGLFIKPQMSLMPILPELLTIAWYLTTSGQEKPSLPMR